MGYGMKASFEKIGSAIIWVGLFVFFSPIIKEAWQHSPEAKLMVCACITIAAGAAIHTLAYQE